jgi:hypothetical protein
MCFLQESKKFWNNSGVFTTCTMCVLIRMYIDGYDIKYAIYQARNATYSISPGEASYFPVCFVHHLFCHSSPIRLHEPSTAQASIRSSSLMSTHSIGALCSVPIPFNTTALPGTLTSALWTYLHRCSRWLAFFRSTLFKITVGNV